jgi:hypothetical protein
MKKQFPDGSVCIITQPRFNRQRHPAEFWKMAGDFDASQMPPDFPPEQFLVATWTLKSGDVRQYWYHAMPSLDFPTVDRNNIVEVFGVADNTNTPDWPHTGLRGGNYYNATYRGNEVNVTTS